MEKLRILQIVQREQLRGAEVFASQLSHHLELQGHEVIIVTLFDGPAKLPFQGKVVNLRRPQSNRFWDVSGWRALATMIKDFKPDIVQANAGDTLKFAAMSKVIFRWKVPLIFRNASKTSDFITNRIKLLLNKFFVAQVDYVVSVSELCRLDFIATYGYGERRTITIPIGVDDHSMGHPVPEDLQRYYVNRKVILSVASLSPEKNHKALVRLAAQLVKKNKDIVVLVVGEGALRKELQLAIETEGLANHMYLLGNRTDVISLMNNAQVLAVPSLIEGLPAVILEAFSCRLLVVANDVGGISEVVKPGTTGWLINKEDEVGFLAALEEALSDSQSTRGIKNRAQLMVAHHFANTVIAERFVKVYNKLKR